MPNTSFLKLERALCQEDFNSIDKEKISQWRQLLSKWDVEYSLPNPPQPSPASVSDDITISSENSLSGSGDSGGASTDRFVSDSQGNSTERSRSKKLPAGATFKQATVTMKLNCDDGTALELKESGNVSASGKVEGNCIVVTTKSTSTNADGVVETVTTTKRKCCGEASFVLAGFREEFLAFKQEMLGLAARRRDRVARPRAWLGIGVNSGAQGGIGITAVLPNSPALRAGLRKGDRIAAIGAAKVNDLTQLRSQLQGLPVAGPVEVSVLRGDKTTTLAVTLGLLLFGDGDVDGDVVTGKKCDSDCDCTVNFPNGLCGNSWTYRGDGPNGGVLYEKTCITIDTQTRQIVVNQSCGKGEYF